MKKTRTFIALLAFFVTAISFFGAPVSAHVLKTDGNIGAVLHILPDDNPITKTETTYELAFSGDKNFSLKDCNCAVTFVLRGEKVARHTLVASSSTIANDTFTFDTPGVYDFVVTGVPKNEGSFKAFELRYSVRVVNGDVTTQPFPVTLTAGFALLAIILLLAAAKADGMLKKER
jgi:hypothetical protein